MIWKIMALSILGGMMLTPHDQFWFALACLITIVAFAIVDAINKQGVQPEEDRSRKPSN